MANNENELLLELWSRVRSHVPAKERQEVADIFISVFDDHGMVDKLILVEDIDSELRSAARSYFGDIADDADYSEDDNE